MQGSSSVVRGPNAGLKQRGLSRREPQQLLRGRLVPRAIPKAVQAAVCLRPKPPQALRMRHKRTYPPLGAPACATNLYISGYEPEGADRDPAQRDGTRLPNSADWISLQAQLAAKYELVRKHARGCRLRVRALQTWLAHAAWRTPT